MKWGICGPTFKRSNSFDAVRAFTIMQGAGLTEYRCQFALTDDAFDNAAKDLRLLLTLAEVFGITIRPILQPPYAFGDATDNGRHPAAPAAGHMNLYAQGYVRTYDFVSMFPEVQTWELSNEVNLVPRVNGSPLFGQGQTAKEFEAFKVMFEWIAVLRGMANALSHLRTGCTVGTTSTMFGFLDMLKNHGVRFNRISYHMYDRFPASVHNYWNGAQKPFDLFRKLDSYGLPVTINEINAGEAYDQQPSLVYNEVAAIKSLTATLAQLQDGTFKNLESVLFYTLKDEPHKAAPENMFGMVREDWTLKPIFRAAIGAIKAPA